MVRFHAVVRFDSGEWTVELAKGDRIAGRTVTSTLDGWLDKDDVEHVIDGLIVLEFDPNILPWEIDVSIEWKGEAAHQTWLEEWRARQETKKGPNPPRSKARQGLDLLHEEMLREGTDE